MIIVLSPSKTLDMQTPPKVKGTAEPEFLAASKELNATLKKMSAAQIGKLMDISPKLSQLNYERFQAFHTPFTPKNAKPAIYAFRGDVYDGLDADSLSGKDIAFAQQHLRLLSGLYGLLKPLDLMQAYRLEMGTELKHGKHKNLYQFWGTHIATAINTAQKHEKQKLLINLASEEYFKVIDKKALEGDIVSPAFKEKKGKEIKMIALFAKKARGTMASYIIRHRIMDAEKLKDFNEDGYRFAPELSSAKQPVFIRSK